MLHQPLHPRTSSRPSSSSSRSGHSRITGSSKHTGDSSQRVTVPLPRSFRELQNSAVKLFGHSGELKMFLHGSVPIQDPSQLSSIQDGDVVVVTWNDRRLTNREFTELLQSTNQRDFVKHALPKPAAPLKPAQSNLPFIHSPFEGVTSYSSEYVKHPVAKRESVAKPSHSWSPPKGKTGTSSYTEEYPWRDVTLPDTRPRHRSQDAPRSKHGAFVGCTSYMHDYIKPPPQPKPESTPPRPRPKTANPVPFQGQSTYVAEYTEKPLPTLLAGRQKVPNAVAKKPKPFEGKSDYQENYIQTSQKQPMIHLEPEVSRSCTPASSDR